jgi:hypothetical protein
MQPLDTSFLDFNDAAEQNVEPNAEIPHKPRWAKPAVSPDEALAAFRRFAESHGVVLPPEIIADGQLHRCARSAATVKATQATFYT